MDCARAVRTDGREEVLRFEPMRDIIQFLAIPRKENRACSWSVSNSNNVTLYNFGTVICGRKSLVVAPMPS